MIPFLTLLGTLTACNAWIGAHAFAAYKQQQSAFRLPCASVASPLPARSTRSSSKMTNLVVRYADTTDDGNYDNDQPLFSQSPAEIFAQISDETSQLISFDDLTKWTELQELLEDGEILISELQTFYDEARGSNDELDGDAFARVYTAIDDLFEDDVDDTATDAPAEASEEDTSTDDDADNESSVLSGLLSLLSDINADPITLPCGLECKDGVRDRVSGLIETLREDSSNLVKMNGGVVDVKSLIGTWNLLYTSSFTMIVNKSLSGLGRSSSEGAKFGGLKQILTGTKYYGECKFVERIDAGEGAAFDVVVDGEWELKDGSDPYTGERNTALKCDLGRLEYPGNSAKASDWASLGPVKMLDIVVVIDDIIVLQGVTLTGDESVFVWQKDKKDRYS